MEKVEVDGKIAVIYSPGYGAGWSSWCYTGKTDQEYLCMDAELVRLLQAGNREGIERQVQEKLPDQYIGGLDDLKVAWVPKGMRFEIREHDGNERLHIIGQDEYMTA